MSRDQIHRETAPLVFAFSVKTLYAIYVESFPMLYLIYGTDTIKAREKARSLIASLTKKKPDATLIKLDADNFTAGQFEESLVGQGLFERTLIVYGDELLQNGEAERFIVHHLTALKETANIVILLEKEIAVPLLLDLKGYAEKCQVFEKPSSKWAANFNIFSLSDAFGSRDRKALWTRYATALRRNISPEEMYHVLFWQLKNIFLVAETSSAAEAGLAPFVWSTARRFRTNFSAEELRTFSSALIALYHDARRGTSDLDRALERFILTV